MDKQSLLEQLEHARERAAAANLESVMQSQLINQLETEGRETANAEIELASLRMTEQRHLREMGWILDQLETLEW